MVNENRYRYLWTMERADEEQLFTELSALGTERTDAETVVDQLAERSREAAKDALRRGMRPSRVAKALGYTDGYVRKLRIAADLPPDPRYSNNAPPVRGKQDAAPPETRRPGSVPHVMTAAERADELVAGARALPGRRHTELVELLARRQPAWLNANREPSDWGTVEKAIRAGLLTVSDWR